MKIPERWVCDYCEHDLTAAVEYLILHDEIRLTVKVPTKLERAHYEFCDLECLQHWAASARAKKPA